MNSWTFKISQLNPPREIGEMVYTWKAENLETHEVLYTRDLSSILVDIQAVVSATRDSETSTPYTFTGE